MRSTHLPEYPILSVLKILNDQSKHDLRGESVEPGFWLGGRETSIVVAHSVSLQTEQSSDGTENRTRKAITKALCTLEQEERCCSNKDSLQPIS